MRDFEALRKKAKALSGKMKTIWTAYDFTERSTNPNKRVPDIDFSVPVKMDLNEVHYHNNECGVEVYLREYQFQYEGDTFIFELATHLVKGTVKKYFLEVYTPAGDGVGGKHKLFSEKI